MTSGAHLHRPHDRTDSIARERIADESDFIALTVISPNADLASSVRSSNNDGLLQRLLDEQQQLTAVEEFSRQHEAGTLPAQARYYEKLLPASPPKAGEQYAFEVDLDRCSGCKACVTACHSLNGLDDEETWRDVGLLVGGTRANPVMQHVTTACHHCLEPACMTACPVDAYEKDPTGIVKHLDDQCFGCQYCTLACPYDVPKYHGGKGIVRKCDMCSDRLAVGEAPACVQACPHEAIAIRVVDRQQVIDDAEADYVSARRAGSADHAIRRRPSRRSASSRVTCCRPTITAVNPQHPHWPLIVMLVLTQMSVGAFVVELLFESVLELDRAGDVPPTARDDRPWCSACWRSRRARCIWAGRSMRFAPSSDCGTRGSAVRSWRSDCSPVTAGLYAAAASWVPLRRCWSTPSDGPLSSPECWGCSVR